MSWLQRLKRLCRQSEIRLPRRPPRPEDLRPGDRLQIASSWWRIVACRETARSRLVLLESDGATGRRL